MAMRPKLSRSLLSATDEGLFASFFCLTSCLSYGRLSLWRVLSRKFPEGSSPPWRAVYYSPRRKKVRKNRAVAAVRDRRSSVFDGVGPQRAPLQPVYPIFSQLQSRGPVRATLPPSPPWLRRCEKIKSRRTAAGATLVVAPGSPQGPPLWHILESCRNKARMFMKTKHKDKKSGSSGVEKLRRWDCILQTGAHLNAQPARPNSRSGFPERGHLGRIRCGLEARGPEKSVKLVGTNYVKPFRINKTCKKTNSK